MANGRVVENVLLMRKSFEDALRLVVSRSVVELAREPDSISAVVIGDSENYTASMNADGWACSCKGQTVRKGYCKHLVALALECLVQGIRHPKIHEILEASE